MNGTLATVLGLSLGGTLMALLLWGIKLIFASKLPSAFYYYAWLPVLLRFVLPLPGLLSLPSGAEAETETRSAYYSSAPRGVAGSAEAAAYQAAAGTQTADSAPEATSAEQSAEKENESGKFPDALKALWRRVGAEGLLTAIWAAGAALCFARYALSYARFTRALERTLRGAKTGDREVFRALCGKRRPRLVRSGAVKTPMLVGALRPTLVLPDRDYDRGTLENILRHELTHYRRHDVEYKWFAVLVYSLHWFNPVTRLVRRELDRDYELSCDERLLRRMDESEKRSYGETLITLAANRALPRKVVATTFATEKKNLKERLVQIMTYKKKSRGALALMLVLSLLLCACGAVSAPTAESAEPEAAATAAVTAEPAEPTLKSVTAATVDELLAAIAPDTEITLASGTYDLSAAANYGAEGGEYYSWNSVADGYELVISGVSNLSITGGEGVTVSAAPRFANVLKFQGCEDINLKELTVGHTEGQGTCSGGVVFLEDCGGVQLEGCGLYGCGTIGVFAMDSSGVHVSDTDIYDCSEGAAQIISCYDVLFDGCEVYDCVAAYAALFDVESSSEVALINSFLHSNNVVGLAAAVNSTGVYLGGVRAEKNEISNGALFARENPITVDGCSLGGAEVENWFAAPEGYYQATDTMYAGAVSPDGAGLDAEALAAMELIENISWTAKTASAAPAPTAGEDGAIHVSTVDELLAAIAPDTTIYLEDGEYDLSTAANYGLNGGEYYSWNDPYDGPELIISGADNLTIKAGGKDKTSITAVPRYANVLRFEDCDGLTLEGFTAGHEEQPGACTGGVVYLENCGGARIDGCGLYGCGVIGVWAYDCEDMSVVNTEIYDCSFVAVSIHNCKNASFENCDLHDNGNDSYWTDDCENVTVDGKAIENTYESSSGESGAAVTPEPTANLHIYYGGNPKDEDILLHAGEEAITLSAGFSAEDGDTEIVWSSSDEEALRVTSTGTNTCTVECLAGVPGGVRLTAKGGGTAASITVYCVE